MSCIKTLLLVSLANLCITMSGATSFMISPMILESINSSRRDISNLEGIVESASYILRILSGYISDKIKNRKIFLVISYIIGGIGKYMLPMSVSMNTVLVAKITDKIGNGLAASPRDALTSDIANNNNLSTMFGVRYFLQYSGSLISSILLLYLLSKFVSLYQIMIFLSFIPTLIGIILISLVKEPSHKKIKNKNLSFKNAISSISKKLIYVLLIIFIFKLGYYSGVLYYSMFIENGLEKYYTPWIMISQNLATVVCTIPFGWYADQYSKRNTFIFGSILLLISHICFHYAESLTLLFVGVILYGLQIGITHNILSSFVVTASKKEYVGFGFGLYYTISSISVYLANYIVGNYENCFLLLSMIAIICIFCSIILLDRET